MKKETRKKRSREYEIEQVKIFINIFFISAIIILNIFIFLNIFDIKSKYDTSVAWAKSNEIKTSTINPKFFHLNNNEILKIDNYVAKKEIIYYNNNFTDKLNEENLNLFKEAYQNLPSLAKYEYENEYNSLIALLELQNKLNKFFDNNGNVKEEVKLSDINNFINEYTVLFNTYADNEIIKSVYEQLNKLVNDGYVLSDTFDLLSESFIFNNNVTQVKESVDDFTISEITNKLSHLNYSWNIVSNKLIPILDNSVNVVNDLSNKRNNYNRYLEEAHKKELFEQWINDYNYYVDQMVELPNFISESDINKIYAWSYENNINIEIKEKAQNSQENIIIAQNPDPSKYRYILKGSTIQLTKSVKKQNNTRSENNETNNNR